MLVNNICFIHIPKAGGTSIEKNILEYENNIWKYIYLKVYDYIADIIKIYASLICYIFFIKEYIYIKCKCKCKYKNIFTNLLRIFNDYMLKSYHSTYLLEYTKLNINNKNININNDIKFFSCVRHPQSRLVSLYTFLQPNISFDKFVIGILSKTENEYEDKYEDKNNHNHKHKHLDYPPKIAYQEQTSFLVNEKNEICVEYIKLEEIHKNNNWKDLCKKMNIPYKSMDITNNKKNSSCKDSNKSSAWKAYYDKYPYIVEIVKDYYKNDFINFNYDLYLPDTI